MYVGKGINIIKKSKNNENKEYFFSKQEVFVPRFSSMAARAVDA